MVYIIFINIEKIISNIATSIWNYLVVGLCILLGVFFTWKLRGVQFTGFGHAIQLLRGKYDNPNETGHISHFQALSAALSGTIGIGNMAGVAIAITLAGPGVIVWMWVMALIGMASKFAECSLSTIFRQVDNQTGEVKGGPMYYIENGLGKQFKPLAIWYALCMAGGAVGIGGMFQSNQVASLFYSTLSIPKLISGLVVIGGIKRIGYVASRLVPTMCVCYLTITIGICIANLPNMGQVIQLILTDALTGKAIAGGTITSVIIMGVRRAIFSNEAGLGSAGIAHASVKTNEPIREGVVASLGPLIDTIIVCTATGLMITLHFGEFPNQLILSSKKPKNLPNMRKNSVL